jgi:hypothetical protein
MRQHVLGDLLHLTDRPLGEDELVGLFERTALARNRTLIRRLAAAVLQYDGSTSRSDWARELYKRVTFHTGPRLLDALTEEELDALIRGEEGAEEDPPSELHKNRPATSAHDFRAPKPVDAPPVPDRTSTGECGPVVSDSDQAASNHSATFPESPPTHELEAQFQRAMLSLYQRTKQEVGYNARHFLRMIVEQGGVAAAKRLVMTDHPSDGFSYLWEHRRLDLTVEALVIAPEFDTLFDADVVAHAKRRLQGDSNMT